MTMTWARAAALILMLGSDMAFAAGDDKSTKADLRTDKSKMQDWKAQAVEQGVRSIVSALAMSVTRPELDEAQTTYTILLRHEADALGTLSATMARPIFDDTVESKLKQIGQAPPEARRTILKQDKFTSRVTAVDDFVQRSGEKLVSGGPREPNLRSDIDRARKTLNQLATELHGYPELENRLGPKISESMLDCRFILEGGEPSSLRLTKFKEQLRLGKAGAK